MAYIYKITNNINQKVYIGKTLGTVNHRFRGHISDCYNRDWENRPLYRAMKKYGVDNFTVETIEECSEEDSSNREEYWIQYYNSFIDGYNATRGGDGKRYADYDLIVKLYNQGKNNREIRELTNYDGYTITRALENYGITEAERKQRGWQNSYKAVVMLDKNTLEELQVFESQSAAERFLGIKPGSSHIASVCKGKRKTAQGYSWKYLNE